MFIDNHTIRRKLKKKNVIPSQNLPVTLLSMKNKNDKLIFISNCLLFIMKKLCQVCTFLFLFKMNLTKTAFIFYHQRALKSVPMAQASFRGPLLRKL